MRVFISYAREDVETARRIYEDLKNAGVMPWMDEYDLMVGMNWKIEITKAIRESDFFLAVLSSQSLSKTGYVQRELRHAMDILDEMPPGKVYLLPARLDECRPEDDRLRYLHWADLFPQYDDGMAKLIRVFDYHRAEAKPGETVADEPTEAPPEPAARNRPEEKRSAAERSLPEPKYRLRNKPLTVSDEEFRKVFRLNDDFKPLEYVTNEYQDNGDGTITDRATGLTWQKAGSENEMLFKDAGRYIDLLNRESFAGHSDWRLPTIDELMSLLAPTEKNGDLYIDHLFDADQDWCWSADSRSSGGAWHVLFSHGFVSRLYLAHAYYVRAVRP